MNAIEELAKKTGRSKVTIYHLLKKYNRLPTEEEIFNQKKGRPKKYNY